MASNFTITGVKEIELALKTLGPKVGRKVIRQAIRKGVKPIQAAAKADAPKGKTGLLKSAIKVRAMRRKRGRIGVVAQIGVGDFQGKSYYGAFKNFGTKRMPGVHFMEKAYASEKNQARDTTAREILAGIEREAKP